MENAFDSISRREFITILATACGITLKAMSSQNQINIPQVSSDNELEKYYNTAMSKLAARDVEGADMISGVAERFPSSAMAYFIAGNAVLMDQRKNPDERQRNALDKYTRTLQLDDKLVGAYLNRGAIRSSIVLPGIEDVQERARKIIRGDLEGASEVNADRLEALEKSVADFKKAIALKPNLFAAYYNMGYFLSSCSREEEAIKSFSKAIEIGLRNADWSSYIPTYKEEAITEVITGREGFCLMGGILKFVKDRFGTFRVGTDRIVMLDDEILGNNQIFVSSYLQDEQEALAFAYFGKGVAYAGLGKAEEATADFKKAISLNPNIPRFYLSLVIAQSFTGKYEDVKRTTTEHIALLERIRDLSKQVQQRAEPK